MVAGRLIHIEEDDHVRLPGDMQHRLHLRKGDVVAVIETEHGLLLAPRETLVAELLDEIGAILTMEGLTPEAMMESGAEIREELVRERYNHKPLGPNRADR